MDMMTLMFWSLVTTITGYLLAVLVVLACIGFLLYMLYKTLNMGG